MTETKEKTIQATAEQRHGEDGNEAGVRRGNTETRPGTVWKTTKAVVSR